MDAVMSALSLETETEMKESEPPNDENSENVKSINN